MLPLWMGNLFSVTSHQAVDNATYGLDEDNSDAYCKHHIFMKPTVYSS